MPTYELHITIDLSADKKDMFISSCTVNGLKPIFVGVKYSSGFARFVQTSRYISGDLIKASGQLKKDSALLSGLGFIIIREKIEAIACTIDNPMEYVDDDLSSGYYETHVVFGLSMAYLSEPYTAEFRPSVELNILDKINSDYYSDKTYSNYKFYVPLSFNLKRSEENQCFLTLRHYKNAFDKVEADEKMIIAAVTAIPNVKHVKTIREFVIYDTNCKIDAEIVRV